MTLTGLAITAFVVALLFLIAAVMVIVMDAAGVNLPLQTPAA